MENKIEKEVEKECTECEGARNVMYSCCSGEIVNNDSGLCPECYEHLGEEPCEHCSGTGIEPPDVITDRHLALLWWHSLDKDFSENSQFTKIHKFLETESIIGFSSTEGRLLTSLTGSEIEKIYKHLHK